MHSELYAVFGLCGTDLDPDRLTPLIGITPTRTFRIGDPLTRPAIGVCKQSGWVLKSDLPLSADLENHVKDVIERLQPGWAALVELGSRYEAHFSCVVHSYGGDRPAIYFDPDIVKRIAELNATIEVDLYVLD